MSVQIRNSFILNILFYYIFTSCEENEERKSFLILNKNKNNLEPRFQLKLFIIVL
jgi:hypothetical protein